MQLSDFDASGAAGQFPLNAGLRTVLNVIENDLNASIPQLTSGSYGLGNLEIGIDDANRWRKIPCFGAKRNAITNKPVCTRTMQPAGVVQDAAAARCLDYC